MNDVRALVAILALIFAVGTASSIWPALDDAAPYVLGGAAVLALAVAAVRREIRIRRRLRAIQPLDRTKVST